MNKKKLVRKLKGGKILKAIGKNYIDKNKEKEDVLCEADTFYTVQGIF